MLRSNYLEGRMLRFGLLLIVASALLPESLAQGDTPQSTNSPTANPTFNPTTSPTFNPTFSPTLSPTFNPTFNPTYSPTTEPTDAPTDSPTESPTVNEDAEAELLERVFVILGIVGIILFFGVIIFVAVQTVMTKGSQVAGSSGANEAGTRGVPIYAAPLQNNRDSMSTLYSRDRWSTVSGGADDTAKIEATEGKDNNLMELLRDKRHEHNIKMSEKPKNARLTMQSTGTQKRQLHPDTKSMKEMDAENIDESDL